VVCGELFSLDDKAEVPDFFYCTEINTEIPYLYFGNSRHRNWKLLQYLEEINGTGFIDNLWKKADSIADKKADQDVFSIIMHLSGMDRLQFGDLFAEFVFNNLKDLFNEQLKRCGIEEEKIQASRLTVLQLLDSTRNLYAVPIDAAPQPYGYNIIRLFPEKGSEDFADSIEISFRGVLQNEGQIKEKHRKHPLEPHELSNPDSDWRYGLLAVKNDSVRSRRLMRASDGNPDCILHLQPGENEVYLIVAATPMSEKKIFNNQIYYSIYRYPWMVKIKGAVPQGYQTPKNIDGRIHSNGGGFVAQTANVEESVYVGPHARVLDNAILRGNVRVEDYAVVKGNAVIYGDVIISGHALVGGGLIHGSSVISQCAKIWAGEIYEHAQVKGQAIIDHDSAIICGNACIDGVVCVNGPVNVYGNAQLSGDGIFGFISVSEGIYYSLSDYYLYASKQIEPVRRERETEVTAPVKFLWYDDVPVVCRNKAATDDLQVKAIVSNGMVTVSVNGNNTGNASLKLMDIGGRVLYSSKISANTTISIPTRVSQKVLLWKVSSREINKNGIVMADR
jgi:hypothetical protein